jgi:hypothetical protein
VTERPSRYDSPSQSAKLVFGVMLEGPGLRSRFDKERALGFRAGESGGALFPSEYCLARRDCFQNATTTGSRVTDRVKRAESRFPV